MSQIKVVEVKTRKQRKQFVEFPLKLYKDNPYFVPPLYADEMKMFRDDYVYHDTCEAVFYNAYDADGRMVGRIQGILQKAYNEKHNEKRIRFTRFDSINDREVAAALFDAVEQWGRDKGMDTICGPLGYSDLEREGLLIEGFDKLSTFEEQYNAEYYQHLIDGLGYVKEVDWTESMIYAPDEDDGTLEKMTDFVLKRYNLHFGPAKNTNDFLRKYADQFFELLDKSYADIYGTVPFTDGMKKMLIDNFKLIIKMKYVAVIVDENDKVVCLGLCFPSMGSALQKSGGRLTPFALIRLLHTINHPKIIDLGLIGVDPEYLNRGINVAMCWGMLKMIREDGIDHCETNLNLENNYAIQNMWKRFKEVKHKRRRSYIKKLV